MLFVKIHYGLGNQLFQYALARSLSLRLKTDFRLDTDFFSTDIYTEHPRVYQLNQFDILEQIAGAGEAASFVNPSFLQRRWRRITSKFLPYYKRKVVNEVRLDFDENIFKVNDGSYLFGYWQDLRYFLPIEGLLRKELTFKHAPAGGNKEMLKKITETNAVSIHIRRGDYVTDSYTVANVGVCDLSYYQRGVETIAKSVQSPEFYIFSDEPEWVKQHFKIDYPHYIVSHNSQENAFEDLRLMRHCKHHIISNSSFSWWGAWLGDDKDKIVIAPRVWRSKGPGMYLPDGWTVL